MAECFIGGGCPPSSLTMQGVMGNTVLLQELMWFRPRLKRTHNYFDRRWPPFKTDVCNYTGYKRGALRPAWSRTGWSSEGPWERLCGGRRGLGRHGHCVTVGEGWLVRNAAELCCERSAVWDTQTISMSCAIMWDVNRNEQVCDYSMNMHSG